MKEAEQGDYPMKYDVILVTDEKIDMQAFLPVLLKPFGIEIKAIDPIYYEEEPDAR